jgi:predicted transposase YbfD/YdcC
MAIPLLESLDLTGKTLTADALLTQRKLASYALERKAHYVFTVKDNQPTLREAIQVLFQDRKQPDYQEPPALVHGRIEQRSIWISTRLNDYLDFPGVGQVFAIERRVTKKKTGKTSTETVLGLTSHTPQTTDAARVLTYHRGHWSIENSCHYLLDWNWDEDRCTIRTGRSAATKAAGHGPANLTALRRFAIGIIKSKTQESVATTIQRLARNVRLVFDYLRMTQNSRPNNPQRLALAG